MTTLVYWQQQVSKWHSNGKHDQVQTLAKLIHNAPDDIWGPELSIEQSKALGCWLDSCARMYKHHLGLAEEQLAYQYLCLAQAKLQNVVGRAEVDQNIRMCCSRKLENVTVLIIQFCKHRRDPFWQQQMRSHIEGHIKFMTAYPLNDPPIPSLKPCQSSKPSSK
ncbi:hypothetical protein [Vibrio gallicus]|uniref:hypothetical protein n=1 Tax=Vibrio gallicus TaxID=190897 RepID=UPI0021C255F1|nr:hypothetical protein [Vibrio gallicus]